MFESLQGRQTQFYIDVLYGVLFLLSFAYLALVEMTPLAAGFTGGLVVGYFLHVWEKMVTYERILKERVSVEAERQVSTEVDEQEPPFVEDEPGELNKLWPEPESKPDQDDEWPPREAFQTQERVHG